MKAWRRSQGSDLQFVCGEAVVLYGFLRDEPGVDQDAAGSLEACWKPSLDFPEAITRLGFWVMNMGQVMQRHDRRAVKLQRPQRGLMVQFGFQAPSALVEAKLHEGASRRIGTGQNRLDESAYSAVPATRGLGECIGPAQSIEQTEFDFWKLLQRLRQLQRVFTHAGPRCLEYAGIKGDPHLSLRLPLECGFAPVQSAELLLPASSAIAIGLLYLRLEIGRCPQTG